MTPTCEDAWFRRFQRTGDPAALAAVFDATAPELLRVAGYLTGEASVAEDLVQETFLAVIERRADYDQARPVLPWLLGILANMARRRRRRDSQWPGADHEGCDPAADGDGPLDHAARLEIDERLRDSIRGLPEPYRAVVSAHLLHGVSARAIAELRGCPSSTVRNQIRRGLDLVRRGLPVGVAGTVAGAALPGNGLVAIRAAVLARASTPGLASGVALGGLLLMSKKLMVLAVLVSMALLMMLAPSWFGADAIDPAAVPDRVREQVGEPIVERGRSTPARELVRVGADVQRAPGRVAVEVRVTWSGEDTPKPGVPVRIMRDATGMSILARGETDAAGRVRFEGVAPGRYFAWVAIDTLRPFFVESGPTAEVHVHIRGYGRVSGRVVDEVGDPIAGATLLVSSAMQPDHTIVGVSGTDGCYTLRSPAINVVLYAEKHGHGRSVGHEVVSFEGEQLQIELRVGSGARPLRGLVLDESGRPVSGARVSARMTPPQPPGMYRDGPPNARTRGRSRDDGRFRIANILPGRVTCTVRAAGYAAGQVEVMHPGGEVRIALTRGATIAGTVRDRAGHPVAGATVSVDKNVRGISTRSDDKGAYEFVGVGAGRRELEAFDPSIGASTSTLEIHPGVRVNWNPILERGHVLEGRVVDEAGQPLAGWHVQVHPPRFAEAYTDRRGRFRILALGDRSCRVTVHEVKRVQAPVRAARDARPGDGPIELVVSEKTRPTAFLVGQVVRPKVFEESRVVLRVYDEQAQWCTMAGVGRDGALRIGPLPPGQYEITPVGFLTSLSAEPLGPFMLGAGVELDIGTIVLPTPTVVKLHPRIAKRAAPRTLWVTVKPHDSKQRSGSHLWRGGFYDAAWAPGRYTFEIARGEAHLPATLEIDVIAGTQNDIPVDLTPGRICEFVPKGTRGPVTKIEITDETSHVADCFVSGTVGRRAFPVGTYFARCAGARNQVRFTVGAVDGPPLRVEVPVR